MRCRLSGQYKVKIFHVTCTSPTVAPRNSKEFDIDKCHIETKSNNRGSRLHDGSNESGWWLHAEETIPTGREHSGNSAQSAMQSGSGYLWEFAGGALA